MLKIIFDTNIFKRTELNNLEDYALSNCVQKLLDLIKTGRISDVQICMNETAFLEYLEQIKNWYQEKIVDGYNKIFDVIKDSYPAQVMSFRSSEDFLIEYGNGLLEYLKDNNIMLIKTVPDKQENGMSIADVLEKTIQNIAPFDKKHNKDLKDAFISETNNSYAKRNEEDTYLFITENKSDFVDNQILIDNYKIEFVYNNKNQLFQIFQHIKRYGSHVDDKRFFEEFAFSQKVKEDIKNFYENYISGNDYYLNDPHIKEYSENCYFIAFEMIKDENDLKIKFYVIDGTDEYECGLIYDIPQERYIINKKYKLANKYINYKDETGEEIYLDEF